MSVLSIVLIAAGAIIFIISFIMPEMGSELDQIDPQLTRKQIKEMIDKEMTGVRDQVSEIVEETSNYSVEKTERALERLTNEKISAVSEYSDTVMEDIHKSHEEVMFLYDMLNNKHEDLKETASAVSASVKEARVAEEALQNASMEVRSDIMKEEPAEEEEQAEEQAFHSETAREFFARHEEDPVPSIDEIRASFQPMAFGSLPNVEEDERVFGQAAEEGKALDLSGVDEEEVDAAIDELLGVSEEKSSQSAAGVEKETGKAAAAAPMESLRDLDTEAAMDAALAALTAENEGIRSENAQAAGESVATALENEAATNPASDTAIENEMATAETAGVFTQLQESLTAIVKEQEQAGDLYAADEEEVKALVKEKPARKASGSKRSKSGGKEGPGDIALQFRVDQKGDNNNEKILKLHQKGKSNIAIAKELGLGVGEVKLVLDLFKGM